MSNEFISHAELVSASQFTIKDTETSLSADRQVQGDEHFKKKRILRYALWETDEIKTIFYKQKYLRLK